MAKLLTESHPASQVEEGILSAAAKGFLIFKKITASFIIKKQKSIDCISLIVEDLGLVPSCLLTGLLPLVIVL